MKKYKSQPLFGPMLIFLVAGTLWLLQLQVVCAQPGSLVMKDRQIWKLGDMGCLYGSSRAVFASDADSNGLEEIMTVNIGVGWGGSQITQAQLRVWIWNGTAVVLKESQEWYEGNTTSVSCVQVVDVDGDGVEEIVTGGRVYDGSRANAQLRIWTWNGTALTLETSQEWVKEKEAGIRSLYVDDLDNDGRKEIVTGGYVLYETGFSGQIRVYDWDGAALELYRDQEFSTQGYVTTDVNAVHIRDIDGDGAKEILAAGCVYESKETVNCNAFLSVWSVPSQVVPYELYAAVAIAAVAITCVPAYLLVKRRKQR